MCGKLLKRMLLIIDIRTFIVPENFFGKSVLLVCKFLDIQFLQEVLITKSRNYQPGGGGYPSQVWMVGGRGTPVRSGWWGEGVPWPGLDGGGGVPQSGLDGGGRGYPGQVLMVGGGTPARS